MIQYRKLEKQNIREAARLISDVYTTICKDEASKEVMDGIRKEFTARELTDEGLLNNIGKDIMFGAFERGRVIGVILGDDGHINQLFVYPEYHHQGIATELCRMLEEENHKRGFRRLEVKSSLYAREFYEKQGFIKTAGISDYKGMKCYPMEKKC